jgi:hypothetical protein
MDILLMLAFILAMHDYYAMLFGFTGYAEFLFCLCGLSLLAIQTVYANYPG